MVASASLLATTSPSPPTSLALLTLCTIGMHLDDIPLQGFNLPLQGSSGCNQRPGQTGLCEAHAEAPGERVQVSLSEQAGLNPVSWIIMLCYIFEIAIMHKAKVFEAP